jgi:hypothetical protein
MGWATTQAGRYGNALTDALVSVQSTSAALAGTTAHTSAYYVALARYEAAKAWLGECYLQRERYALEMASRDDGGA